MCLIHKWEYNQHKKIKYLEHRQCKKCKRCQNKYITPLWSFWSFSDCSEYCRYDPNWKTHLFVICDKWLLSDYSNIWICEHGFSISQTILESYDFINDDICKNIHNKLKKDINV